MIYEQLKHLKPGEFKRLCGVRSTWLKKIGKPSWIIRGTESLSVWGRSALKRLLYGLPIFYASPLTTNFCSNAGSEPGQTHLINA